MSKKIMFVMTKTLGDVILSTTLVRELKKEFPSSEISVYTNNPYGELFRDNPDVVEVCISDHWHWNQLFLLIHYKKWDHVFLPYQTRPECNSWHQDDATRNQHLVDFYWHRMGMHRPITDRECYLHPSSDDHHKAERHISFDVPRVAIHSTTNVPTKDWLYFNELTEELRQVGYSVIQVGGSSDKRVAGAVDLCGKMGLLELAAFLSKCAVFVGLDSGLSYMADAMRVPTVVIQGSTNPVTSGPISDRVIHLFTKDTGYTDCQEIRCHANCRHEINCITKISVDDVFKAIEHPLSSWLRPVPVGV